MLQGQMGVLPSTLLPNGTRCPHQCSQWGLSLLGVNLVLVLLRMDDGEHGPGLPPHVVALAPEGHHESRGQSIERLLPHLVLPLDQLVPDVFRNRHRDELQNQRLLRVHTIQLRWTNGPAAVKASVVPLTANECKPNVAGTAIVWNTMLVGHPP